MDYEVIKNPAKNKHFKQKLKRKKIHFLFIKEVYIKDENQRTFKFNAKIYFKDNEDSISIIFSTTGDPGNWIEKNISIR